MALTYTYNFNDKKYRDYVCILSVLAQVSIDSAKRRYDIDISNEIRRIKGDMEIDKHGYPKFWTHIRRDFNKDRINQDLKCPMNYLCDIRFPISRMSKGVLPISYFFKKFELKENRRKSRRVERLIEKYSLALLDSQMNNDDEYFLMRSDFDELIEEIRGTYISKEYRGLMSWLVNRAFLITPQIMKNDARITSTTRKNKAILLKTLYTVNSSNLLDVFSKNV